MAKTGKPDFSLSILRQIEIRLMSDAHVEVNGYCSDLVSRRERAFCDLGVFLSKQHSSQVTKTKSNAVYVCYQQQTFSSTAMAIIRYIVLTDPHLISLIMHPFSYQHPHYFVFHIVPFTHYTPSPSSNSFLKAHEHVA